jgi:pimeloyl-ACP methyl ester carboxylesterase
MKKVGKWGGIALGVVVLLVHGGAVGGDGFQNWQVPLVNAGYRVVLPDLLGYGYSDRPDVPYTKDFYTGQLRELLDGLGIHRKVNVIGASLGGTIATTFTAANPARVGSVTMMAPSGGGRTKIVAGPLDWPVVGDWIFRVVGASQVRSMIADSYQDSPARDGMVAWMADQARYSGFGEGILNTIRNYDSTWQPEPNQAVGRTNVPVLAVWGTDDKVNPYQQSHLPPARTRQHWWTSSRLTWSSPPQWWCSAGRRRWPPRSSCRTWRGHFSRPR